MDQSNASVARSPAAATPVLRVSALWAFALAAAGMGLSGCVPESVSPGTDARAMQATPSRPPLSDGRVIPLNDTAQFKQVALRGGMPVIVDFYKVGCPPCVEVDGVMAALAREYDGRVVFTKFLLMQRYFAVTSPELRDRYSLSFLPVVILFVNGQEKWRLTGSYTLADYRKAIDQVLALPGR